MSAKQAVIDFIEFENATSAIYPWAVSAEEIKEKYIDAIVNECNGSDDTEVIYCAIDKVCGVNPILK